MIQQVHHLHIPLATDHHCTAPDFCFVLTPPSTAPLSVSLVLAWDLIAQASPTAISLHLTAAAVTALRRACSMFVIPQPQQPTTSLPRSGSDQVSGKKPSSETITSPLLSPISNSMERGAPEYSQSGLPSPYPSTVGDTQSEASSADHATAATAPYGTQQEVRPPTYSATATPTSSDYGVYPGSARSTSFPDTHIRSHYQASNHGGSSGGMAQTPTSPSMPTQDGRSHQAPNHKSDTEVPIDPSIAAPSPTTYAHGTYSPYAPPQDMSSHAYSHPGQGIYPQARPDWAGYGQGGGGIPAGHHVFSQTPASAAAQSRPNQVCIRVFLL